MRKAWQHGGILLGCLLAMLAVCRWAGAADDRDAFEHRFQFKTVVVDPASHHVHAPGQDFSVTVTPFMLVGQDLSDTATVSLVPASDATKSQHADRAQALLFDGKDSYGSDVGVMFDFFFAPKDKHELLVKVPLKTPAAVKFFSLAGFNMNGQFGVSHVSADLLEVDGPTQTVTLPVTHEGALWRVMMQRTDLRGIREIDLHLDVPYKINLTEMTLRGTHSYAPAEEPVSPFKAREWLGLHLHAHWQTADGKQLTQPVALQLGVPTKVPSPADPAPGYYGLRIEADQDGMVTYQKEYGFAVMPTTPQPTQLRPDSMFGMVHMDFGDTFLHTAWTKTLTCDPGFDAKTGKLNAQDWQDAIDYRRKRGYLELPLAINGWRTDPKTPVTKEQLTQIANRMEQFFRATPDVLYYELGIEENLGYRGSGYKLPYFWSNTEAKAKAVRAAAQKVNPKIKLVYQIAEFDFTSMEQFCTGSVSKQFDVLSLHPYAWETFPMPDTWMPDMIDKVHGWMKQSGHVMPIWFTEVGAPDAGNPGGFFGYPPNTYDNGLSRSDYATYVTRMHVVAASTGVEKLFWYHYADGDGNPYWAESHFGLVDAWGYPKPGYVAYANLVRMLDGRHFVRKQTSGGVSCYLFSGAEDDCWVIWRPEADAQPEVFTPEFGTIKHVVDNYGRTIDTAGGPRVGGSPLFVIVAR